MSRLLKSPFAKEISFCLLSAILLIFSFPRANLWILSWFGFVPLFFVLEDKSKAKAFLFAYFTGVIFWSGIIYWLIHVTLPGTIVLILYLAIYFGIFGLIVSSIIHRPCLAGRQASSIIPSLFIPSVWVLLEYLRSHLLTGFPWALLGYSQYLNLPIIQIADITGVWGVSFLIMMINMAVYSIVCRKMLTAREKQKYLLPALFIIISLIYGYYKLYHLRVNTYGLPLKICVIQGNIPQEAKWDSRCMESILKKYLSLTASAARENPDLIVWPEAASPGILGEDDWVFQEIFSLAKKIKIPLIVGAVVKEGDHYYGSALLVNSSGSIAARYDKLHLVPFGEYIPFKKTFPFLQTIVPIGDIERGKDYTVFKSPAKFSVLDCFEDTFPELAREFVKHGAKFLVNITNDAWYKKTSAPYQHLQASVFRALENRVYLVRAANTGISGFISPEGKIISLVKNEKGQNLFISGFDTNYIKLPLKNYSFYTRHGDIFIAACFLFIFYGIIRRIRKAKIK
ncbi:MAG: apolipoprotein N-acyltransferase [Candidatus Omnitrophota bacterium]